MKPLQMISKNFHPQLGLVWLPKAHVPDNHHSGGLDTLHKLKGAIEMLKGNHITSEKNQRYFTRYIAKKTFN